MPGTLDTLEFSTNPNDSREEVASLQSSTPHRVSNRLFVAACRRGPKHTNWMWYASTQWTLSPAPHRSIGKSL